MKKKKRVKEFYFKDLSKEEFKDLVNLNYPINIKYLEDIIIRVHNKYPAIDKSSISLIIKGIFESIRDFLLLGYVINFNKFVFDMKLNFFQHVIKDKLYTALRVKLKTPPKIKTV